MKNMKREFKDNSWLTNGQFNRVHETNENETCEMVSYVFLSERTKKKF